MKATVLIEELAQAVRMAGDREVLVEIHDHDGHFASNERTEALTFVADHTYVHRPILLVARSTKGGAA